MRESQKLNKISGSRNKGKPEVSLSYFKVAHQRMIDQL